MSAYTPVNKSDKHCPKAMFRLLMQPLTNGVMFTSNQPNKRIQYLRQLSYSQWRIIINICQQSQCISHQTSTNTGLRYNKNCWLDVRSTAGTVISTAGTNTRLLSARSVTNKLLNCLIVVLMVQKIKPGLKSLIFNIYMAGLKILIQLKYGLSSARKKVNFNRVK